MPRDLPLNNGRFLVNFDFAHNLRDIYFPQVGTENHAYSSRSSMGVWVDGSLRWLEDEGWQRDHRYVEDQLTAIVTTENRDIGLVLEFTDVIDFYLNAFIRRAELSLPTSERWQDPLSRALGERHERTGEGARRDHTRTITSSH